MIQETSVKIMQEVAHLFRSIHINNVIIAAKLCLHEWTYAKASLKSTENCRLNYITVWEYKMLYKLFSLSDTRSACQVNASLLQDQNLI